MSAPKSSLLSDVVPIAGATADKGSKVREAKLLREIDALIGPKDPDGNLVDRIRPLLDTIPDCSSCSSADTCGSKR